MKIHTLTVTIFDVNCYTNNHLSALQKFILFALACKWFKRLQSMFIYIISINNSTNLPATNS